MKRRDDLRLRFEAALALAAPATLLPYKLFVAWPGKLGPALVGWLVEASLLWLCYVAAERGARRFSWLSRALFLLAFYSLLLCSTAHAFFFESATERRFSLIEVGLSGILYFFGHVLPARGYLVFSLVLASVHAGALWLRSRRWLFAMLDARALGLLLIITALALGLAPRAASPVVDAVADVYEKLSTETIRARSGAPRYAPALLDHSASAPGLAALPSPFKKIVVLVMETMTAAAFELERKSLPASSFVNSALARVHRYERYFPNNQDSRTGMLDMLSSRFIPYDAYTEQGRDNYVFLAERSSLAEQMGALGFETAFAVSQSELELVVGDLPWQHRIHLDDQKLAAARSRGLLCFTPYEFEHSCEDRALLPDIFAFLDAHERAFVYQEFIWGHASIYNQSSGLSNAAYYSSYVDALIEHLRERGTLDETLIVLTSDHGFRDTSMQDQLAVYRIPLWFYATRFSARRDDRLFSHLSFKDLLHGERTLGALSPPESPFVMIFGPTSASLLAVLTRDQDFLLLKLHAQGAYVLRHARLAASGAVLGKPADAGAPQDFLRLFNDYRRYFRAH